MRRIDELYEQLNERILVLDGAMGTMIQKQGLSEEDFHSQEIDEWASGPLKGCNDVLSLSRYDVIMDIHQGYVDAGADIITTNTFGANRISLSDYHLQELSYDMNLASAELARAVVDAAIQADGRLRFVAGSVGPTNKTASLSPDVEDPSARDIRFEELVEAYGEQIRGLLDGRVDLLLIETVFDTLNCKAALFAAKREIEAREYLSENPYPVMVSITLSDASGRTLSGQTIEAVLASLSEYELLSIGLNCSMGATEMLSFLRRLSSSTSLLVSAHPNAGLPDQFGAYSESAAKMGKTLELFMGQGLVNIIGGCCGTTYEHIRVIKEASLRYAPRTASLMNEHMILSGLEALEVSSTKNFINIGERTNVAGSRKFARLIREGAYEQAASIARDAITNGAQIIDICMDDPLLDAKQEMRRFIDLISTDPDIALVPFMIDSSDFEVIETGLQSLQGHGIVNSISLKEGPELFLHRARTIRSYGAAMVVMLFDEQGQADTYERKISIAERCYRLLVQEGIRPAEIIFDPNVLSVATGIPEHDAYALDFIRTVKWIKENCPHAKVSGGVSNLSFSFRGNNTVREAMHSVFLYHAVKNGMDMGIVNPGMLIPYQQIETELLERVEDVILCRRVDAAERLSEYAQGLSHKKEQQDPSHRVEAWRSTSAEERITYSLTAGITDYLQEDITEARISLEEESKDVVSIIEGPLMEGMKRVGELFSEGKMFLPQVVKSARVMKKAVELLLPFMPQGDDTPDTRRGRVVLATVKGDVHDIGKNIVSVVLACNNLEVFDLGVMVPSEKIVQTAIDTNADIIALSGLITPSLQEMITTAELMEERGLDIPLLVGGATTSDAHTALKIAPVYRGPVIRTSDASSCADAVARLLSDTFRKTFIRAVEDRYEKIRDEYAEKGVEASLVSPLSGIEVRRFSQPVPPANEYGRTQLEFTPQELLPYMNWKMLLHTWKLPFETDEAQTFLKEARELLEQLGDSIRIKATYGLYHAGSEDQYVLLEDGGTIQRIHFLRDQLESGLCLADYIVPVSEKHLLDTMGLFSVTIDQALIDLIKVKEREGEKYQALLLQSLSDRLVEAGSEYLHLLVRRTFWGYAPKESLSQKELLKGQYVGIRPAPGYPSCPDHSQKEVLLNLLGGPEVTGIELTEHMAMIPSSSVCGYYIAREEARYFSATDIGTDQLRQYAQDRGMDEKQLQSYLAGVRVHQVKDVSEKERR